MYKNRKWIVHCPQELADLFPERRGYYFKINMDQAKEVVRILSDAYDIEEPKVVRFQKRVDCNGRYNYLTNTIEMHGKNHLKMIFHEFYHHLVNMTDGDYNSNDRSGGSSSLSWQFADRLWEKFRVKKARVIT